MSELHLIKIRRRIRGIRPWDDAECSQFSKIVGIDRKTGWGSESTRWKDGTLDVSGRFGSKDCGAVGRKDKRRFKKFLFDEMSDFN